jgi:uncharacterized membrane protein
MNFHTRKWVTELAHAPQRADTWIAPALWVLATASALSHVASIMLHLPQAVTGALLALSLLLFGLVHGGATYGWRGIAWFIVVCLGVSNLFENLSILTGFPFGWYHYTHALGPRLFMVPLLIGPAYFGVGYLSWTLSRAILGDESGRLNGVLSFAIPVIASFIMVSWDLTIDPMMSTITGNWIWHHGGSYFGVPLVNFLGWFLTVDVFFQLFALYVRRTRPAPKHLPANYWAAPMFAYTSIIVTPLLSLMLDSQSTTLADPAGELWQVRDIHAVTALVGLFTVLPFWLVAVFRTASRTRPSPR